ncbi:hypothetical protein [Desulfobacterium sp. N47]|uniref:Uncharacterized protein n=1 Tax=uncultured Desulfobacterium sp. TaxID=201089 RepID=E1YIW9_9BACT|nr:unknown protein [uncultured Desulfobacterium sp.]
MAKVYDTFVDDISTIKEGELITIAVRETDIYKTRVVKAVVASSKEKLPDGETLLLRYNRGYLRQGNWFIKIKEDVPGLLVKGAIGDN